MRRKCERRRGNINADAANAEVFAGDECSQGASFGPIAAISRREQGRRIYNNTRARVLLRRMCVKSADLTAHSPPKTFARPRTATRPSRALPLPHAVPTHARRLCDAFPADLTTPSPPKTSSRPRTATRPSRTLLLPHAAPTHARWLRDARPPTSPPIPAEDFRSPPHSDTPFPSTSAPPRSADARPQAARCIPRQPHNPFPAEDLRSPPHSDTPFPSTSAPPRSTDARPQAARCTPADLTTPSPHSDTLPLLPFRFGHKKTAPHSACAMPNVSVDRRCGRSFGLVSRALFAAVAGRWRVGVELRPQPWALRSRRCGRVLRA